SPESPPPEKNGRGGNRRPQEPGKPPPAAVGGRLPGHSFPEQDGPRREEGHQGDLALHDQEREEEGAEEGQAERKARSPAHARSLTPRGRCKQQRPGKGGPRERSQVKKRAPRRAHVELRGPSEEMVFPVEGAPEPDSHPLSHREVPGSEREEQ